MPTNARISELDALNIILSQAADRPVNSTTNIPPNATRALEVLREITLQVQEDANFWHFNTEKEQVLEPDAVTGKIQVASNVVSVSRPNLRQHADQELTLRGEFLYDLTKSTYVFESSVTVDLRVSLEWSELPVQIRRYITLKASRQYQLRFIQDPQKHSYDIEAEQSARALAIGSETREQNLSMLDNPTLNYSNRRHY